MAKRFYGLKAKSNAGKFLTFSHKEWLPVLTFLANHGGFKNHINSNDFLRFRNQASPANLVIKAEITRRLVKELDKSLSEKEQLNTLRIIRDLSSFGEIYDSGGYYSEGVATLKHNLRRLRDFFKESGGFQLD